MRRFTLDRDGGDPQQQVDAIVRTLDRSEFFSIAAPGETADGVARDVATHLGVSVDGAKNLISVAVGRRWSSDYKSLLGDVSVPAAPELDDPSYSELVSDNDPTRLDKALRAIATLKSVTYLEAYEELQAARHRVGGRDDVPLSRVLEKTGVTLRSLEAADGLVASRIRTLANLDDDAGIRTLDVDAGELSTPAAPAPLGKDIDRLEILSNVGADGLPAGPALVAARRAHVIATDEGVNVGPFDKTFQLEWIEAVRQGIDLVETRRQEQQRLGLLQARHLWISDHDQRVLAGREQEAKRLEREAAEAASRAEAAAARLQVRSPFDRGF